MTPTEPSMDSALDRFLRERESEAELSNWNVKMDGDELVQVEVFRDDEVELWEVRADGSCEQLPAEGYAQPVHP